MDFTLIDSPAKMLVAGEWVDTDERQDVIDPTTGQAFQSVPVATPEHIDRAVAAAREAQAEWKTRTYMERAEVLERCVQLFEEHREEIAQIVTKEQGKPLAESRGEVGGAQAFFNYAISQKWRVDGQVMASNWHRQRLMMVDEPLGVVAAIIPWNFPSAIFGRKAGPALMAGNAIIIKPSSETPLTSLAMARLCLEAGLPKGLMSVLTGPGSKIGNALVTHPGTDMITVTGSTRAGKQILAAAADKLIPVSLELGGKAPFIIFDDADLDMAVQDAADARLMNCGQVCTCNERLFVQRGVADEVIARLAEKFREVKIGLPTEEGTTMGPKVSGGERDKVREYVESAVASGAKIEVGGVDVPQGVPSGGYWVQPTLLTNVSNDMEIAQHEVFGPILPVVVFDDYDQVVAWSNSTQYGLTSYAYTSDLNTAMRLTQDLEFGEVYVNQQGPETVQGFHTGWKASGLGGDDGPNGFEKYLRKKTLYINYR